MRFRYTAVDTSGQSQSGELEAASAAEAREQLEAQGLAVRECVPLAMATDADEPPITAALAEQLVGHVADLHQQRVPLPDGLRAAAESVLDRRLATALRTLAVRLEQGATLEDAVAQIAPGMPPHLLGLLRAVSSSGGDPEVLLAAVDELERLRDLRHGVWLSLAYPLLTLLSALLVFVLVHLFVVSDFRELFIMFELQLPLMTQVLLWWSSVGAWVVIAALLAVTLTLLAIWATLGTARWRQIVSSAPLFGAIWLWGGAAQFARLVGLLLRCRLPLPEVLELTAASVNDSHYQRIALDVSQRVRQGSGLSQALEATRGVPASLIPFARSGEQQGLLSENMTAAALMFDQRVRNRAEALKRALPPLTLVIVLMLSLFTIIGLFLPLLLLINAISPF